MKALAIVAVVATIALGVVVGVLYLQRARRSKLVKAHLYAALAATALVALLVLTAPGGRSGGPPAILPVAMLAVATAGGYVAWRTFGRRKLTAELILAGHLVLGIAGFFVLLAFAKTL